MEEQTVTNRNTGSHVATTGKNLFGKLLYYLKNGQALYWFSFFLLILIEFLLGGQLSKILTKDNYSLYVNVLNTLPFYNVVVNLGLSYGIVYIVAYNPGIKFQLFRQSVKLQTAWYIFLVAVHLSIFFIFNNVWTESLLITILISYTYSYRLNINSFFLATRSYNKAALANALQKVALVVIFIVIHYVSTLGQSLNNNFLPVYPTIEFGVVLLYFIIFWQTNYQSVKSSKINYQNRILKYSKYAMLNNGFNLLNYTIIAFIIRSAHIDFNIQIILLLCVVFFRYTGVAIAPVFSIMNPLFTAIKNDTAGVNKMYRKYYVIILVMSLCTLLACRLFFGIIITNFYAKAYRDLPAYFNFFAYLIPLSFLNSLNASVMAALGKIKYTFRVEVVCTIVLVLFFSYDLLLPIVDYKWLYYIILIHLTIKFLLQSYGAYKTVNK